MTSDWPQILHAMGNLELICAYQISSNSERKKNSGLVWFVLLIKVDLPIPLYFLFVVAILICSYESQSTMFQLTRRLQLAVKPRYRADTPSLEQRKYHLDDKYSKHTLQLSVWHSLRPLYRLRLQHSYIWYKD